MIKALLFLVKMGLLVGAVLWVAEQPGRVRIEWLETVITIHVGFFFAGLLVVILSSIFIYRVIRTFVDFPASYRYYSKIKGREKGLRALTLGLTAVAAGDTKTAMREAKKARGLLPEDEGLPLLLEAQSARLDGREGDAQKSFVALLESKDSAFLGVRGLLQSSLERGEYDEALRLARKALALHPKQKWILRTVYDLEIRARHWRDAQAILDRGVKAKAYSKDEAKHDRVAMALAVALEAEDEGLDDVALTQYKAARKLDKDFVPAVILLAEYYVRKGQRKKAAALVERTWKRTAHTAYVSLWAELIAEKKRDDALSKLKWFEKLIGLNGNCDAAFLAAAGAAIDAGLWGEARAHLDAAVALRESAAVFKAYARLEEKEMGDQDAVRAWLDKAGNAAEDAVWYCEETGRVYESWRPIVEPHGSFNTIQWGVPHVERVAPVANLGLLTNVKIRDLDDTVIEAPKVA